MLREVEGRGGGQSLQVRSALNHLLTMFMEVVALSLPHLGTHHVSGLQPEVHSGKNTAIFTVTKLSLTVEEENNLECFCINISASTVNQ